VGADGANSAVRSCMAAALPGFSFDRQEAPLVYKRFKRMPCPVDLAGGGSVFGDRLRSQGRGRVLGSITC
jgi:hypothetical protein